MDRMSANDSLRYWLALAQTPGIGAVHFHHILQHCPDPAALFGADAKARLDELQLPDNLRHAIQHPDWPSAQRSLDWASAEHCHILTWNDPRYPALLKQTTGAPPLLYVRGDPGVLSSPQLAIVGSRNPSPGGQQNALRFAESLAACGLTITSGLALGIDAASHQGALQAGGKTIAVAGTGLDRVYPPRHKHLARQILQQGAMVSEFPPGTPPLAANFPRRNRLISGMSLGTLVVEAALQSGSLITARLAAEQGREVFAMPGSIHNPLARGCHALLRQGAKLTESIDDVLEELAPLVESLNLTHTPSTKVASPPLDPRQALLMTCLGFDPNSIDALVIRSGLTPEVVSSMLVTLELQGRVTSTGGLYCRTD